MYLKKIVVAVLISGIVGCSIFAYHVYGTFFNENTSFNNKEAFVYIKSTDSFRDVQRQIIPLVKDISSFQDAAVRKGYANNVKGGKYRITKGMNNNEIINSLRIQNIPVTVSFNNQERLQNLAQRLSEQIEADSAALYVALSDPLVLKKKGLNSQTALALYIPNSYQFFWNTSATEFVLRMNKEYDRFWNEERRRKAAAVNLSLVEVVTLAAIVHKETAKVDERPKVAGVYLNRLRTGMKLQADPTVIYGVKEQRNDFNTIIKRVLYRDLESTSAYNTYKHSGLPPGPITMPDITAVEAVLNAKIHRYFYFVADTQNFGYHKFAENLAQHNRNKQQYVQWLNRNKIVR